MCHSSFESAPNIAPKKSAKAIMNSSMAFSFGLPVVVKTERVPLFASTPFFEP